jgi:hypothetical protein
MKKIFYFIIFTVFVSCNTKNATVVKFDCTGEPPSYKIFAVVNEVKNEVESKDYKSVELAKDEYTEYKVPADALSACWGTSAGMSSVYYAVQKENNIVIYKSEFDEANDGAIKYSEFKTIPIGK